METLSIVLVAFATGFGAGAVITLSMYIRDMEMKK